MDKRNTLIDFTKGLLILGVIWGHTITSLMHGEGASVWILTFFRTYDMPFFMIIAGYLLNKSSKKRDTISLLISKVLSVFFPLLIWELIIGLSGPIFVSIKNIFSLWYLWSYLSCAFIMIAVNFVSINDKCAALTSFIITIVLHILPFEPPFNIGYMYPYICIGFYIPVIAQKANSKNNDKIRQEIILCVFIVFVLLLCFWDNHYNVWSVGSSFVLAKGTQIITILFRFLIGLVGCFCMWFVFNMLHKSFPQFIVAFFEKAGQNSMMIYILQTIIVEMLLRKGVVYLSEQLGYNPFVINNRLLGYFLAPIIGIITIALSLLIINTIIRIPKVGNALTGRQLFVK